MEPKQTMNNVKDTQIKLRKARKDYECRKCLKPILKGCIYESGYIQTEDMRVFPRKYHKECGVLSTL